MTLRAGRPIALAALLLGAAAAGGAERVAGYPWIDVPKAELIGLSEEFLARNESVVEASDVVHRINVLEMDWDLAGTVYTPRDEASIPIGPDGRRIGIFLLHGGSGDHRSKDSFARLLVAKLGVKVVTMSYPGRYYLEAANGDWPGDTIGDDTNLRTPVWKRGEIIGRDQYEVVKDTEDTRRRRWGTLFLACAKPGSRFYDRMAGWPLAHEHGAGELIARHLPAETFSVYVHGHSTGGPMSMMLTQRIDNIVGVLGMESSPFGSLYGEMTRELQGIPVPWAMDFNCLRVRSWRDTARYHGYELAKDEGVEALARLAMVMEEVHESWQRRTTQPNFKAENILHFDSVEQLIKAAEAAATRVGYSSQETASLVARYLGYLRGVSEPGARPVPPIILIITNNSRDHRPEFYRQVYLPGYAMMNPAPKVTLYAFDAGIHNYSAPEDGLPQGVAPAGASIWFDAIMSGYFLPDEAVTRITNGRQ